MDGDLKYEVRNKAKCLDRRSKTETAINVTFGDDSLDKMMIIGKGFPSNRTRATSFPIHECHSDTSINPFQSNIQDKKPFPIEGLCLEVSDHPSVSTISFASAKSDVTIDALQKKLHELESELSGKDATILFLKKQLNKDGDNNIEFTSVGVETEFIGSESEESHYQSKLNELTYKIEKREKTISALARELEENIKIKETQIHENKYLSHEVNHLKKQLRSMNEVVHSKHREMQEMGIDLKEFAKCKAAIAELEEGLFQRDEHIIEMEENLKEKEIELERKQHLFVEMSQKFAEYKKSSSSELNEMRNKVIKFEKHIRDQDELKKMGGKGVHQSTRDEIVRAKEKLEVQYQKELKEALERCRSGFKKLSEMPKAKLENVLRICEAGKFDAVLLKADMDDQRALLEKKFFNFQEEKKKEINQLIEGYESKISNLKSQILSLNQQLKERKETLDTFEKELKMHREEKKWQRNQQDHEHFNELQEFHAAQIQSENEKHTMEKNLLQDKVNHLTEEVLSYANKEKIRVQELQSAKEMASSFREKYELLLAELEKKNNDKKESDNDLKPHEFVVEDSLSQFRSVKLSLKKGEEIPEDKINILKQLDAEEILVQQKEINYLKAKLIEIDRFQMKLVELDEEVKGLIKMVEDKFAVTLKSLHSTHYSEVKLKEMEINAIEQQKQCEISELQKKVRDLEDANEKLNNEMRMNKVTFESEMNLLKHQAEELAVELLGNEGMLVIKNEIEDTLTKRIQQLEGLIEVKNENSKKQLERALSKCIMMEALLSAKEEITRECESRIAEDKKNASRNTDETNSARSHCSLQEAFRKLEGIAEIIFEMKKCEDLFELKKKIENIEEEFRSVSNMYKNLEEEHDELSKENKNLVKEKKELAEKFQKIETERDEILNNFISVDEDMRIVMKQSRKFENELLRAIKGNKLVEANCAELIENTRIVDGKAANMQGKIEVVGDVLVKAPSDEIGIFSPVGNDYDLKAGDGNRELELALKDDKNEILIRNNTLKANINLLSKRVESWLLELNSFWENEMKVQLYSDNAGKLQDQDIETKANVISAEGNVKMITEQFQMSKPSFREEMVLKLEIIQKEMSKVMGKQKEAGNNSEGLGEETNWMKEGLNVLRQENCAAERKITTELQKVSNQSGIALLNEVNMTDMGNLSDYVKTLAFELELIKKDNERLMSESRQYLRNNNYLKGELEEAWSHRSDVEDQLEMLKRENALLNHHRDQLEETNKKISSLISDGTPRVVSWLKIHETVENIVDVVQALKTFFTDLKPEQCRSKSDVKAISGTLHLELEKKTKLCQQLLSQKTMLEKELESIETLMKQSENFQFICNNGSKASLNTSQCQDEQNISLIAEPLSCDNVNRDNCDLEKPYMETLHRLKKHYEHQVHLQKAQLTNALVSEIEVLKKEIQRSQDASSTDGLEALTRRHRDEIKEMKRGHEIELEKLRNILQEMTETGDNALLIHEIESKHGKQMEELRLYFEKKCAELEKNFSEEVFSQHSRKLSEESDVTIEELPEDKDDCDQNVIRKYRSLLDEEEDDVDRRMKYMSYITEIVRSHEEKVNCMKTKHDKEMSNLRTRLEQMREEFEEFKKISETDKKSLIANYEKKLTDIVVEERRIIASELEKEFDSKVRAEIRRLSALLQAATEAQQVESVNLEENCVEKLSVYETESAIKKVETERELEKKINRKNEEKFRKKLEEEKVKIAQHYKDLNEAALIKFNEEQENLIKSHSEVIHRLIQEHEERVAELKRMHKQDLEKFHCDGETKLIMELRDKEKKFERELSSVKSTYEDELYELKKCCQDMLNEQVSLAKSDAFNTLQKQIQDYLNGKDEGSPTSKEVIELGEKFAGKYRREIDELKQRHLGEVARIRTEYEEKIRRRYSTGSLPKKSVEKMEMKTDDDKLQILRERDALQEMVSSLRHVLSELIRYVGSCEEELNNTIVCEFSKNEETVYKNFALNSTELNESSCSSVLSKKVHFAPDLSNIISEINDSQTLNTTLQVRAELDRCLKQLKNDASHLLALSNPSKKQDENLYDLLLKMEEEKNQLVEKIVSLEEMQKDLKLDVSKTKGKLAELERTRETVSEGYGEEIVKAEKQEILTKLKEKAKVLMGQHSNQPSDILNVLDEICRAGDRFQEEARRERNDLQLQVAAADKQLRATRKFLEEQAAEREIERDDYINEIKRLKEVLRVRERDRSLQDMMNEEIKPTARRRFCKVESLDNQLKEANGRIEELEQSKADVENQLKEAVDKIWTLREIIRDLEGQISTLSEGKTALELKVEELECTKEEQIKVNRNLAVELDNLQSRIREEYVEQIKTLEEELGVLRVAADSLSPEALTQIRDNIREIELALTKKTKDLEQQFISSANVSCCSPAEDISLSERHDTTGCPTPDEMQNLETQKMGLPLEEIERINEKLLRHTRAEEVAIKTVRDLKMQLKNNRKAIEELQIERDVLFERADKYLQENSRLKVRLDEQRCNAGIIQKQLSADLETQIKKLELEIENLNDLCLQKDKQIRDMNVILEQTMKTLKIREAEVLNRSNEESEKVTNLKMELIAAMEEKKKLEDAVAKMKETIRETVSVPFLMDTMLDEKNAEIDRLEKEVARLSSQRATSSLLKTSSDSSNSTKLKKVKFSEPDSFIQFISPILQEEKSIIRCASDSYSDLKISTQKVHKPNYFISTPESLSSIGPLQLSPRGGDSHLYWNNSHAVVMSSPKELEGNKLESLRLQVKPQECQASDRNNTELDEIRVQLKSTMDAVEHDKSQHKKELEKLLESESNLRMELDSKKRKVSEHLLEIDTLKRKLAELNLDLENVKSERQKLEGEIMAKDEEIEKLNSNEESLLLTMETLKRNHLEEVEELQSKLNFEHNRVESVLEELKILEVKKVEIEEEFLSLKEDYNEKLNSQQELMTQMKAEINELTQKNEELCCSLEKTDKEMEATLVQADKLSKDLTDELAVVKSENDKLKCDYANLKIDLENCMTKMMEKMDVGMQTEVEMNEDQCQMAVGGLKKADVNEEVCQFQSKIDNLKLELCAWEQKMNEKEFDKDEALSYAALIRTLISSVIENLDDHFYELQTCRRKIMECSVDDLFDKVQKELLISAKLDNKLLSNFQEEMKNNLEYAEDQSTLLESGGGDNNLSMAKKKQNLVNLTVKLCELETNLQDMEHRNKKFEEQIASLKSEKDEEKRRADGLQVLVKLLEDTLAKERAKLAEEKDRCDEDAKIMEVLKANFELFVERVEELERALTSERQHRMTLEKVIKKPSDVTDTPAVLELKYQLEVEQQKCLSLVHSVEKEKKKIQELKIQLEQEKLERLTEKDVQRLLNRDLTMLQEQKDNLETQLVFARELLQTRQSEIIALKRKINLQEIDIKALSISSETQHERDTEISTMAAKLSDMKKELDYYRNQVENLNEKSENISAPLLMKMKILNNCVEEHVQVTNEMGEALLHLTQETEQMRSAIKKIEETAENGALSNSSDDTILADVETERKSWMAERERLTEQLERAKLDYEVLKKDSVEMFKSNASLRLEIKKLKKEAEMFRDKTGSAESKQMKIPEDRVLHLFGKYLKTESCRKALAFQKMYLMSALNGYEGAEEEIWRIVRDGNGRRREYRRRHRSKRKSFKMVALVIIAIKRMQFLVTRWRFYRLTAFNALMGQHEEAVANKENEHKRTPSSNVHMGQIDPLRYQTHHFLGQHSRHQGNVMRTPPSRDSDSSRKPLDTRKITEGIERFNFLQKNVVLPSRPP